MRLEIYNGIVSIYEAWKTSTYRLLALRFAPGRPPAGDPVGGGGVCPRLRGGNEFAPPNACGGGAGDALDGGAESENDPGDSPEVEERLELGRGGANAEGITEDARGGGVAVLAPMPDRLGDTVCARDGGGSGTFGAAVSAPA